jgi:chemotaxis protein MotB
MTTSTITTKKHNMGNKLYTSIAVCVAFFILSCGTSKKLQLAEGQVQECNSRNAALTKSNEQLNSQVESLSSQNKQAASEFAQYRQQCEDLQAKYKHANDILRDQESILKQIEEKLETALADLEGRGLTVNYKRGLLFVSMEDQLLFKPGSSKIDKNGTEALAKISEVMNDYPDVKVIVVGNTDDKLFKSGSDNWTLSTERANGVVRALRDVYKVDPTRLTSAGRAKFAPVADNSTDEGRAKNRRIEIIFNPDMEKMWDSITID